MNCRVEEKQHDDDPITTSMSDVLHGFQPAFQHSGTGESHLAFGSSNRDSVDSFNHIPEDWILDKNEEVGSLVLHPEVVAGYWRDARFIALSDLSKLPLDS